MAMIVFSYHLWEKNWNDFLMTIIVFLMIRYHVESFSEEKEIIFELLEFDEEI